MKIDDYIKKFPHSKSLSYEQIVTDLEKRIGKLETSELLQVDKKTLKANFKAIYNDYDTNLFFEISWNIDFLKQMMKLIQTNKEYFGETILDLGCGNGYLTCFIASLFPDSRVVGVDCEPGAIKIAKKIADKLGLKNVEFQVNTVNDLVAENKEYDTVFVSKMFPYLCRVKTNRLYGIPESLNVISKGCKNFALCLSKLVKSNGYIIEADRLEINSAGIIGWFKALNDQSIIPILPDLYIPLVVQEPIEKAELVFLAFQKSNKKEPFIRYVYSWANRTLDLLDNENTTEEICARIMLMSGFKQEEGLILRFKKNSSIYALLINGTFNLNGEETFFFYQESINMGSQFVYFPIRELGQDDIKKTKSLIDDFKNVERKEKTLKLQKYNFEKSWVFPDLD